MDVYRDGGSVVVSLGGDGGVLSNGGVCWRCRCDLYFMYTFRTVNCCVIICFTLGTEHFLMIVRDFAICPITFSVLGKYGEKTLVLYVLSYIRYIELGCALLAQFWLK